MRPQTVCDLLIFALRSLLIDFVVIEGSFSFIYLDTTGRLILWPFIIRFQRPPVVSAGSAYQTDADASSSGNHLVLPNPFKVFTSRSTENVDLLEKDKDPKTGNEVSRFELSPGIVLGKIFNESNASDICFRSSNSGSGLPLRFLVWRKVYPEQLMVRASSRNIRSPNLH
jgi:hypothetical protein